MHLLKEINLKKASTDYQEQYWKKKEDEIGEKIRGKMLAEFNSGYNSFSGPILGILFYTENTLYFQTFPRKNWLYSLLKSRESLHQDKLLDILIPWADVKSIHFPPRKNPFLRIILPRDYRIFIDCWLNKKRTMLIINLQCQTDRKKLFEFYKKVQDTN